MITEKIFLRTQANKKMFVTIALLSLVLGMWCISLLLAFVVDEYTRAHENPSEDRIFRVLGDSPFVEKDLAQQKVLITIGEVPIKMKELYPEVKEYCRVSSFDQAVVITENIQTDKLVVIEADTSFSRFFPMATTGIPLPQMLAMPGKAAINEATAELLFGTENALGKSFSLQSENGNAIYEVATILHQSQLSYMYTDILLSPKEIIFCMSFVLLNDKNDVSGLAQKLEKDKGLLPSFAENGSHYLQASSEIYFDNNFYHAFYRYTLTHDKTYVYIAFFAIIVLLFITAFNYINMSLTSAFQRIRTIGIQKVFGADARQIVRSILKETSLTVCAAFLITIIFIAASFPLFNNIFGANLSLQTLFSPAILLGYAIVILLLTIIPAWYIIRRVALVSPSAIFRANSGKQKNYMISSMLSLQLFASILLTILVCVFVKQIRYMDAHININPNIVEIGRGAYGDINPAFPAFAAEVEKLHSVTSVNISGEKFFYQWFYNTPEGRLLGHFSDSNFIHLFNLTLIEGANFTSLLGMPEQIIVNETLVRKKGLKPPVVGQKIILNDEEKIICAVVKDFVNELTMWETAPTYISGLPERKQGTDILRVLLDPQDQAGTLKKIEKIWTNFFPQQIFHYSFLHDTYWEYNQQYMKQLRMMLAFSLISIFLTALGLFGFASYAVETRNKEIGLRKVNGATSLQIAGLFLRRFLVRVIAAWVLAAPLAYFLSTQWLQKFSYKANISAWIYIGVGTAAMLFVGLVVAWQSIQASLVNPKDVIRNE